MDNEMQYHVEAVRVTNSAAYHIVDRDWPTDDRVYGFYPGIIGPGWYGGDFPSLQCPALDHLDTRSADQFDKLWPTPEEAMKAWEDSRPIMLGAFAAAGYFLRKPNLDRINELGIYRHYEKPMIEEDPDKKIDLPDPDPTLWELDDAEEVGF